MVRAALIVAALALTSTSAVCARAANPSGAAAGRLLDQLALDPDACYHVTEINFSKEDVHIYLTSGYLAFAKPVNGRRVAAAFAADTEGGDAEILLIPPDRGERLSLANFTSSPTLEEHFKSAVMIFTDATGEDLLTDLEAKSSRKDPELGALLADRWSGTIRNMAGSFEVRLVYDLLSPDTHSGVFYMGIAGAKLGNFDLVYDSTARDQIVIGQLVERNGRSFFDVWTSFAAKSQRTGAAATPEAPFTLDGYHIDAVIHPDLSVSCVTRVTATPRHSFKRALPLFISREMRVTSVTVDGRSAEVFQHESLRATLIGGNDNEEFLVILPADIDPAKPHELEFHHQGNVIAKAGDSVYFVAARGTWYPRLGSGFAKYDLSFRYPRDLVVVATGKRTAGREDGDVKVSEFTVNTPIRFAGFNLGAYNCVERQQAGYSVDVCANQQIEAALRTASPAATIAEHNTPEGMRRGRGRLPDLVAVAPAPPPPNPAARLQMLAADVSSALQYMTSEFGPPCLNVLSVSPIPGGFGQGFPGLIYLSTLSYLDPTQRPAGARNPFAQTFFSDVLDAHEVAHQWWGNIVLGAGYSDEWITEALADYSALMYLEKKKGVHAMETVLDRYRSHLLEKTDSGASLESSGPITWGVRLISSRSPSAWRTITYEKGAWIMHMIRRRLGDERFTSMLRDLCVQYRYRSITTAQFREVVQRHAAPKSPDGDFRQFFDTWVYGVGIPAVKLTHSIHGAKISGAITTSDPSDFTGLIPVEVQQGRQRVVYWLAASSDGAPFTIALGQHGAGAKITVASSDALIRK